MTEKHIQITAKLLDARDAMRRLHGSKWQGIVDEVGKIIRAVADGSGIPLLSAVQMAKKASVEHQPMISMQILAVACELSTKP